MIHTFLFAILAGTPPIAPLTVTHVPCPVEPKAAYSAVIRSLTTADLPIEMKDMDAGIVRTEWKPTDVGTGAARGLSAAMLGSVQVQRIRFTILFDAGTCKVKPEVQRGWRKGNTDPDPSAWKDDTKLDRPAQDLVTKVIAAIKETAPAAVPTTTPPVKTIDVSTLSGTRGLPEGGEVVVVLVTGAELSGRLLGVIDERVELQVGEEKKSIKLLEVKDARSK